jgi:hypothetical protein
LIAPLVPVKAPPQCRLCDSPATVTLSVHPPSHRPWSVPDPLCDAHADRIVGIMRIPVRREAIS